MPGSNTFDPRFYDLVGNSPESWFFFASHLLRGGAYVWASPSNDFNLKWVALLLRGYAVENMMKGLWVQEGRPLAKSGRFLRASIPEHDLVRLHREVGLQSTKHREQMLSTLSKTIRFLGRYPIPKRHEQMPMHSETSHDSSGMWSMQYEKEFWRLVKEMAHRFQFLQDLPPAFVRRLGRQWRRPCPLTRTQTMDRLAAAAGFHNGEW